MLLYFANGSIRWKETARCNTRTNWEFYAVLDGRCAPIFDDNERPPLQEKTLWIFAPECSHAWIDDGRHAFHRVVFHFGTVPYPLDTIVRACADISSGSSPVWSARCRAGSTSTGPASVPP